MKASIQKKSSALNRENDIRSEIGMHKEVDLVEFARIHSLAVLRIRIRKDAVALNGYRY